MCAFVAIGLVFSYQAKIISDIAIFVLKRDVKLQLTNQLTNPKPKDWLEERLRNDLFCASGRRETSTQLIVWQCDPVTLTLWRCDIVAAADKEFLQRDVHWSLGTHRRLHADVSLVSDDRHLSTRRHDRCFLGRISRWSHRQVGS